MYGAKTARAGYSVETANDRELSFNSEWPLLPIDSEGTFEVNKTLSAPVTIYNHDLGYAPVFRVYYESGGEVYSLPNSGVIGSNCTVDSDNLYWRDVYFSGTPMNLHWKVYRRPIETNLSTDAYSLTGSNIQGEAKAQIVVARPGEDATSSDPRDISFNSEWKQLIIDSSKYAVADTSDPSEYVLTITHNLGYRPMYWGYYKDSNNEWRFLPAEDVYRATVTTTSLSYKLNTGLWGGTAPTMALVIFKSTINNDV